MSNKENPESTWTRRRLLLGTGAFLGASLAAPLFRLDLSSAPAHKDRYFDELAASDLVGFAHNGANQKEFFDEFLKNKVANMEIDTQYKKGRLYVAHHTRELNHLPWIQPDEVDLEVILANLTVNNINPHFDLKESVNNPDGIRLFRELLDDEKKIPLELNVTLSSQEWPLLGAFLDSPRAHLTLFTIDDNDQLPRFEQFMATLGPRPDIGVSLKDNVASEEVISRLNAQGLKVVVWTVNKPKEALQLAEWGAWGITSDETSLLKALNRK